MLGRAFSRALRVGERGGRTPFGCFPCPVCGAGPCSPRVLSTVVLEGRASDGPQLLSVFKGIAVPLT